MILVKKINFEQKRCLKQIDYQAITQILKETKRQNQSQTIHLKQPPIPYFIWLT